MSTVAPLASRPAATISPMPREPPVTTATLPSTENSELSVRSVIVGAPGVGEEPPTVGRSEDRERTPRAPDDASGPRFARLDPVVGSRRPRPTEITAMDALTVG